MLLLLDKSGSMAGKPFEALKKGAQMVSETIFQQNEFQNFVTVFYDTNAKEMLCRNAEELPKYKQELQNLRAGGSTNFVDCFKFIEKYVKTKLGLGDISVIFFTDGQDTCNDTKAIKASMEEMKKTINKKEITSRFLTIGFTKNHDAAFLNNIA
jgi:uncharacterized protein with von Willebrand factor type A (vWA) domain